MDGLGHANDYRSWLVWAGAGVLGLLGLGAWSLLDPIAFPGPSPEQDYPRVAYRPVLTRGNDLGHGGALQSVWTPILFSLPTWAGFSSLFLEQTGDSLPACRPARGDCAGACPPPAKLGRLQNGRCEWRYFDADTLCAMALSAQDGPDAGCTSLGCSACRSFHPMDG